MKWIQLAILFSNFAMPFMMSGVGVTLPAMGRDLQMSGAALGLYETLYMGMAAALVLPAGRLADAGDKNAFFTVGVSGFALATLMLGFAENTATAQVVRGLQGAVGSLVGATGMAILTDTVPRERLGRVMGLNIGAVYLGLATGPYVAGLLTTLLGWRWVYHLSGSFTVGAAILVWVCLPRTWRRPRLDFDWPGFLSSAGGLLLLIAGSASLASGPVAPVLLVGGAALLGLFLVFEKRSPSPLVPLDVLRRRPVLLCALLVQLLAYAGAFGISFLFSLFLQENRGWTPERAGRLLMVSPVLMALFAPISGRLADRVRPQFIAACGILLVCLGSLAAWLVPAFDSLPLLVASLAAHGLGFAMFSSPNMTVIMAQAPIERRSMASALGSQMRSLGMVFSMVMITGFLALNLGPMGLAAPDALAGLLSTMRGALACVSLMALLALVTVWRDLFGPSAATDTGS